MTIEDFLQRVRGDRCNPGSRHVIAAPLAEDELRDWRSRHPGVALPEDLLALARAANGIFLYVHQNLPNGYIGLAPVRDWDEASIIFWGRRDDEWPPRTWLGISRHADGADYVAVDVRDGRYYWVDTCSCDENCIATSVEELLSWAWQHWVVALRPHGE